MQLRPELASDSVTDHDIAAALAWARAQSPVEVLLGAGACTEVGPQARRCGANHALIVTDPGIESAGHLQRVLSSCDAAGPRVSVFDAVAQNPTTAHVRHGVATARRISQTGPPLDCIIGLGGGSAMDCAKGINLLLTNGGEIKDYWGINKATRPLLPTVLIPTTAGTGSEAQSFALISDEHTHVKMACGDRRPPRAGGLRPWVAILDPDLTATVPGSVAAAVGLDALSHAVETAASTARTDASRQASVWAWRLLRASFEASLRLEHPGAPGQASGSPRHLERPGAPRQAIDSSAGAAARTAMLLGAHLAGIAIEQSMLGAAHACANPLTARFGITHGIAVGLMLPSVVKYNTNGAAPGESPYEDLAQGAELAAQLRTWAHLAGVPAGLADAGVEADALPELARLAAAQWTAQYNPRPVGERELLQIYQAAHR